MDRQQKGQAATQADSNKGRRTIGTGNIRVERQQKGKATYRGQAETAIGNNKDRHRRDRPKPYADSNGAQ
jgi:hypothetical protein